jgi:hypothetical protein
MKIATSPCEIAEFQRLKHVGISSRPIKRCLLGLGDVRQFAASQRVSGVQDQLRVKIHRSASDIDTAEPPQQADIFRAISRNGSQQPARLAQQSPKRLALGDCGACTLPMPVVAFLEPEHSLMLAPSAHGDERHLGDHELAERAAVALACPSRP